MIDWRLVVLLLGWLAVAVITRVAAVGTVAPV
jgi:hypothetical protein